MIDSSAPNDTWEIDAFAWMNKGATRDGRLIGALLTWTPDVAVNSVKVPFGSVSLVMDRLSRCDCDPAFRVNAHGDFVATHVDVAGRHALSTVNQGTR
jgi:hypothetical protein